MSQNDSSSRLARRSAKARKIAERDSQKQAEYRQSTKLEPEVLSKLSRRQRRRLYRQQFKAFRRWRTRIIPKTAIGLVTMILAFSVGAATSGVVLFAWYQYRIDEVNKRVDTYSSGFGERLENSLKAIDAARENARAAIRKESDPLATGQAGGDALVALAQQINQSVWQVETKDDAGVASVGTAWVSSASGGQSFLVTSYSVIAANTRQPAPGIVLTKGNERYDATLVSWHPERDVALISVNKSGLPALEAKRDAVKTGDRVFAVSGYGALGASAAQGNISDVNADAIASDTQIGTMFRGAPIINSEGKVVAIASREYAPLGFKSEGIFFSPPVHSICEKIAKCTGSSDKLSIVNG